MSKATNLALANFLSTLGGAIPAIAQKYDEKSREEAIRQEGEANRSSVTDILKGLPQVGSDVLDSMAAPMPPEQAKQVLATTSPQDQQQAASVLGSSPKGLAALRMAMPAAQVDAPNMPSAMQAISRPAIKPADNVVESLRPIISKMESGGNYGTLHPKTKSGKQALGAYGILPDTWFPAFPQFGLDASNPQDKQRFLSSPALQDAMFSEIAKQGLSETGGDLRKFRAWYYGGPDSASKLGTGKEWVPQSAIQGGKTVAMPSVGDDADAFMKLLDQNGIDPKAAMATAPGQLPWDSSTLDSLVKDKPQMKVLPKKVTYGDQERYLLSKVKNPEQLALLKDFLSTTSDLAKEERTVTHDDQAQFQHQSDEYGTNVRAQADLNFKTWKEGQDEKGRKNTAKNETLTALRQQRESLQKQLLDLRTFEQRASSGKEAPELLASAYPEYYTTGSEDPSMLQTLLHGDNVKPTSVTKLDSSKLKDRALALQQEINGIDQALSTRSNAAVIATPADGKVDLSKYMRPR